MFSTSIGSDEALMTSLRCRKNSPYGKYEQSPKFEGFPLIQSTSVLVRSTPISMLEVTSCRWAAMLAFNLLGGI